MRHCFSSLLVGAFVVLTASAQSTDDTQVGSFASGGGFSAGGDYIFASALGETIVGDSQGGGYTFRAGFASAANDGSAPCQNCIDFTQGLPPGTTATGTTPPYVANGVLHLTDAINGQANYWTTPLRLQFVQSVSARWKTLIGGGGDPNDGNAGADGLSFNLGTDLGTSFIPEEGAGNSLTVAVDTFDNGVAEVGIEIKWNGQRVGFTRSGDGLNSTTAKAPLRRNQFIDTTLEVSPAGLVTFRYADLTVSAQLPDYSGVLVNQYVFAARTGPANDNHWIDDLSVHLAGPPCIDFAQGLPAGTIAAGTTPPYVQAGILHLTDATNDQANFWTTPTSRRLVQAVSARWKTLIGGGSTLGADGLSFSLGTDLGTSFIPEEGPVTGLSANIDTWDNGAVDGVGIELKWNGQQIAFTPAGDGSTEAQAPLRPNQFVDTSLDVTPSGLVTFTYAGFSVSAQLPSYSGIDANQYVFAARTGGANDNHWIDDFCIRFEERSRVDLEVAINPTAIEVTEGDTFSVAVTVSNRGPSTATNVELTSALPVGVTVASLISSAGGCQVQNSNIICVFSNIPSLQSVTVALTANAALLPEDLPAEITTGAEPWNFGASAVQADLNLDNNVALLPLRILAQRDFADAPDTSIAPGFLYPTRVIDNGARHRLAGPYFGGSAPALDRDSDPNGMPSFNADGDDVSDGNDDETGVRFLDSLAPGAAMVRLEINAPAGGAVDGWIDFNRDGHWVMAPSVEQIFSGLVVPAGISVHTIAVPAGAVVGTTYARFRISTAGGLGFAGYANDGEVEDYVVTIDPGGVDNNPNVVVQLTGLPDAGTANQAFGYTVAVSNAGPGRATGVSLAVAHQGSIVTLSAASATQGACQVVGSEVRCAIGELLAGQSANVSISVTPGPQEALRIEARATLAEVDRNLADNLADRYVPISPWLQQDCYCSCSTNSRPLTLDALLGSFYTAGAGQYARVRLRDGVPLTTAWMGGHGDTDPALVTTQWVENVYADIQKIEYSSDFVYVTANGLASHVMGPWACDVTGDPFPNNPLDIHAITQISFDPTVNSAHPVTPLGSIGVWVNGTAIYNMLDGFYYSPSHGEDIRSPDIFDAMTGELVNYWHRNAYFAENSTFDPAEYHQEEDGEYHSHASPLYLRAQLGDNVVVETSRSGEITNVVEQTSNFHHSPILGWAFDGHPIYGPYGYSGPLDTNSAITRMRSGYVLRNGDYGTTDLRERGRTTLPAWTLCMQGRSSQILLPGTGGPRPSVDETESECNSISLDLGRYVEDYAYLGDLLPASEFGNTWDLDRYNGRCCITPEFPNGTYAYFVTLDSNGVPAFPYIIGWQYCSQTNGGVVSNITETTTVYWENTDVPVILSGPTFSGPAGSREISLVWSSLEGGAYRVETTEDLQTWTALTPSVTASGVSAEFSYPKPSSLPNSLFYRVAMESLAPYNMYLDPASGFTFRWPSSAPAGSTVTVTIVVDPSLPTDSPIGAAIGNVMANGVPTRTGNTITATFDLPSGMSGSFALAVGFPGPITYTLNDGFTVK